MTNDQNYVNCLAADAEHDDGDGETVVERCGNTLTRFPNTNHH